MGEEGLQSRFGSVTTSSLAAAAANPANQFGRYVRVAQLGSGRMADVWLAYDPQAKREVALKLLVRGSEEDHARLIREAQAASSLSHPAVVGIHETGRVGDTDFIAMEYVRGIPLSRTGVSVQDAARLVREAALAVHHAHGEGILHRDLKPGNLFLDETRACRVADFGLARTTATDACTVTGTPAYLAPEEAGGSAGAADERIDVYALGATLHELVTGEPPYRGATDGDVLQKVLREKPAPPRKVDPRVPADLEAIILKAMARDPVRRYASTEDFAEDLRRFLDRERVSARARRIPWKGVGIGAAIAAVAAGGWLLFPRGGGAGSPPSPAEAGREGAAYKSARELLDKAQRARADGNRTAHLDYLKQAIEKLDDALAADPDHAGALLDRARARAERAAVRGGCDSGARDDLDRLLKKDSSHAEARLLRARLVFAEFERTQGGGSGAHFAILAGESSEGPVLVLQVRPRKNLPAVMRAMAASQADVEGGGSGFARALSHFLRGEFADAERTARQAVDEDPGDDAAWTLCLESIEAAGAYDRALAVADEGLRRRVRNPTLLAHRAVCFAAQGKRTDAEQAAGEALQQEPEYPLALGLRAVMRALRGDAKAASDELQRAMARAGADAAILRWARSATLRLAGRVDEAIDDLAWLLQHGRTPLLLYERGSAYGRRSKWAQALPDLEEAAREEPGQAALELAQTREMLQDFDGALRGYAEVVRKSDEPFLKRAALRGTALLLWARGEDAKAYEALFEVANALPTDQRGWALLIECASADQDNGRLLDAARAWAAAMPGNAEARWREAQAHHGLGNTAEALAAVTRAGELGWDRVLVLDMRSQLHEKAKDHEKALEDMDALIALLPQSPGPRIRRIPLLLALRRGEEAERDLELLEAAKSQAEARSLLTMYAAEAAAQRGEADRALELLREADAARPLESRRLTGEGLFEKLRDRADFKRLVEEVKAREETERAELMKRPFMGVQMNSNLPPGTTGVLLQLTIKGTGARRAGLRSGDRIVQFDGAAVSGQPDLSGRIKARSLGDKVKVKVERGDPARAVAFEREVTLGPRPAEP